MPADALHQLLLNKCSKFAYVDAVVLTAIVTIESSWNPKVMRFEPNFVWLSKPQEYALKNGLDAATERICQRCSWGLGQIMGGTCRGLGFDGFLPDLLDPSLNMDYMILYYNKVCSKYVYTSDKIAAYNSGEAKRLTDGTYFNQDYVNKVMLVLEKDPTWKAAQIAIDTKGTPH